MMYFENPGCKLSNAQKLRIHKIYCPEEVLQPIVSVWNKKHTSPDEKSLSYIEKVERARKEFAPYKAFMVTHENQDESNVVENFTEDSLILILNNTFENGKWHNDEKLMYKEEYLNNRWEKLADYRQPYIHDEDWLHQFDIDCAEFDLTTDPINLREPDKIEYYLSTIYNKHNKFMTNVDHFDFNKVEEEIEYSGLSIGARAKANRSKWTREYIKQVLQTRRAYIKWIEQLENEGDFEKAELVRELHRVPNIKTCDCCNHKYSNDRAKCPICHVENETYCGDLKDRNVDWFASNGMYSQVDEDETDDILDDFDEYDDYENDMY